MSVDISRSRNQAAAAIDDGGGLVFQIVPDVLPADRRTGSNYGPTCEPLASTTSGNISVELGKDNSYYTDLMVCMSPSRRCRHETRRRRTTVCGLTTTARPK
jgi:hypothetical protein